MGDNAERHPSLHPDLPMTATAWNDLTMPLADVPWLLAAAVFALAGGVKGVLGLGLPTVAMGLLGLFMSPATAAAWLIVPSLVTNVRQLSPWPALWPLLRRLGPMQAGVCIGTGCGAWAFGAPAGAWASLALGLALTGYAVWGLAGTRRVLTPRTQRWLGPVAGAVTGVVTAATGVFVVPAVPYLQALGMTRDELVQAMGLSFTVSTLALAAGLAANLTPTVADLGLSVALVPPALAGMAAGERLRRRLSAATFRTGLFGGLAALGLHLVWREVWHL